MNMNISCAHNTFADIELGSSAMFINIEKGVCYEKSLWSLLVCDSVIYVFILAINLGNRVKTGVTDKHPFIWCHVFPSAFTHRVESYSKM